MCKLTDGTMIKCNLFTGA